MYAQARFLRLSAAVLGHDCALCAHTATTETATVVLRPVFMYCGCVRVCIYLHDVLRFLLHHRIATTTITIIIVGAARRDELAVYSFSGSA